MLMEWVLERKEEVGFLVLQRFASLVGRSKAPDTGKATEDYPKIALLVNLRSV